MSQQDPNRLYVPQENMQIIQDRRLTTPQRIITQDGTVVNTVNLRKDSSNAIVTQQTAPIISGKQIISNLSTRTVSPGQITTTLESPSQMRYQQIVQTTPKGSFLINGQKQLIMQNQQQVGIKYITKQIQVPVQEQIIYVENLEKITELEKQVSEYQTTISKLQEEEKTVEKTTYVEDTSKIQRLEEKINLLINEVYNLNQIIMQKSEETQSWKRKSMEHEPVLQQYQLQIKSWETRYSDLEEWKLKTENELNALRDQKNEWESQMSNVGQQTKVQIEELENRIALMSGEIQRLTQQLKTRTEEIETYKFKYSSLQGEVGSSQLRSQQYEEKIAYFASEIEKYQQIIQNRNKEAEEWKSKFVQIQSEVNGYQYKSMTYEERLSSLKNDIEKYQQMIMKQNEDLEKIKQQGDIKIQQVIQSYEVKINELQSGNSSFYQKLSDLENKLTLQITENERLRSMQRDVTKYSSIIGDKQKEIDQLRSEKIMMKQKADEFEEKWKILSYEYEKLEQEKLNIEKDRQLYVSQYTESRSLETRLQEVMMKLVLAYAEIESLRYILQKTNLTASNIMRLSSSFNAYSKEPLQIPSMSNQAYVSKVKEAEGKYVNQLMGVSFKEQPEVKVQTITTNLNQYSLPEEHFSTVYKTNPVETTKTYQTSSSVTNYKLQKF